MPGQRYRSRARRRQSGAAAVEFGLIVLPLTLLIFGIIQYGFYFWSMQAGSAAVRDAARYSAVGSLDCNALKAHIQNVIGPAGRDEDMDHKPDVTVTRTAATTVGGTVEVTVTFKSHYFGFVPVPGDAVVNETAQSRVENITPASGACS